jgi:2-polyprenyl-3-methyl-5-hydroxy-6-metoxy-1,4-benzoquinol methylase
MIDKPVSPLTLKNNVTHLFDLSTKDLVRTYSKFGIDTSLLFENIDQISAYQCNQTGFRFYYPSVEGDSLFYEKCGNIDWYYVPWKWEHEIISLSLQKGSSLLEIGSGQGGFIENISKKFDIDCVGLELNRAAVESSKNKGLNVLNQTIQEHSLNNANIYDVVCSFQVLEHIADVKSFIEGSLICLKPGGKFIISVPNNGSYVFDSRNVFNSPPHHVGMWDETSLKSIANIYNLKLEDIVIEPLQEHHMDFYFHVVYKNVFKLLYRSRIASKLFELTIAKLFFNRILRFVSKWVPGHTVIAIYTKL